MKRRMIGWACAALLTSCGDGTDSALPDAGGQDVPAEAAMHGHPDVGVTDVGAREVGVTEVGVSTSDAGTRALRAINECAPDAPEVVDMTTTARPEIMSTARADGSGWMFVPRCVRLRVGQTVIFRVDAARAVTWGVHPLAPGAIEESIEVADPTSPIPAHDFGEDDVPVTFTATGSYGYYCTRHFLAGHVGAIHVAP
jgi:plastocyanin